VRRWEFPAQHLGKTLGQIKNGPSQELQDSLEALECESVRKGCALNPDPEGEGGVEAGEAAKKPYAAVLIYSSSSDRADYRTLYEETITIIFASSHGDAEQRARNFASEQETEYRNEYGETIKWRFKEISDLKEIIDPLGDGAEVYTRYFRDYTAYRILTGEESPELDR
jgi:hypothetical protein